MRYAVAVGVIAAVFGLGGLGGYVLHGQGTTWILGSGTQSCGGWLEYRKDKDGSPSMLLQDWVNGYLTGAQNASGRNLTERQSGDLAGRSAFIDLYCQSHPLDSVTRASAALYLALLAR